MEDIDEIIDGCLEIQRALAVKMRLKGYSYAQIADLLNVSQAFVEKWRALYHKEGAACFPVGYKGSTGYLSKEDKTQVIAFIQSKQSCQLETLVSYLQEKFGVSYQSKQSYYDLFTLAGMSWKKTAKVNPKKDEKEVAEKKEVIKKNFNQDEKKYFLGIWSY